MNNYIKTLSLGIIAAGLLGGIIWYASQNENMADQIASITGHEKEQVEADDSAAARLSKVDGLRLGSPDAPVVMVEYSSHFCGHCIDFHQNTLPLIIGEYVKTGKVKMIRVLLSNRFFVEAVLCAEEQGMAAEFDDYLFGHVQELESPDDLSDAASQVDLDGEQFYRCFNEGKHQDRIEKWFKEASEMGVTGTPMFFINEREIVGNQPYYVLRQAIEEELVKAIE